MDSGVWFPFFLSLKVSIAATVIAGTSGIALGWLFARRNFFAKPLIEALLILPMVLPPTVVGYGLLLILGRNSYIGGWLDSYFDYSLIFNWHGAVVASAVVAFPLVLKSAIAAFEKIDPNLEAAAQTLGRSNLSIFFMISLPLALPNIMAGLVLAFARAMGEFGASLMVAGSLPGRTQTLSMAIYDASQAGNDNRAMQLVLLTCSLFILLLLLANRLLKPSTALNP